MICDHITMKFYYRKYMFKKKMAKKMTMITITMENSSHRSCCALVTKRILNLRVMEVN